MISIIAAVGRDMVMGCANRLPWKLPNDLQYFKRTTMGHPVIMGRKTFESIGKPLSGRLNVVVSSKKHFFSKGLVTVDSLESAMYLVRDDEAFVIGGASVYSSAIGYAKRLYITYIDNDFKGDSYFPYIDPDVWEKTMETRGEKDKENPFDYFFQVYDRK
ncbi:MAG TPA: dihydrofolate reductase [Clostridia bacterium]